MALLPNTPSFAIASVGKGGVLRSVAFSIWRMWREQARSGFLARFSLKHRHALATWAVGAVALAYNIAKMIYEISSSFISYKLLCV
jgi:hypothetical protein